MGFKCGIVGLPNVGKSTIFSALTANQVDASNYPFCTIEPNIGIVKVFDERLLNLAKLINPEKIIYTTMEFVDIAGLVKGASKGEGLGNQFLSNIRNVDAIAHIVRCFEDRDIVHVEGDVDPVRDIKIINLELILADLDTVSKKLDRTERLLKKGEKSIKLEYEILSKLKDSLDNEIPARYTKINSDSEEEVAIFKSLNLLTAKPILYVANVDENSLSGNHFTEQLINFVKNEDSKIILISGKIENELSSLSDDERKAFMDDLKMEISGLDRMIKEGYDLLGLITFITAGKPEVRGWTITQNTKAPQAAGKIHSDFERGFIRAEVISYDDYIKAKSEHKAKELGYLRLEGKDYIIKDGDIVHFRFNV